MTYLKHSRLLAFALMAGAAVLTGCDDDDDDPVAAIPAAPAVYETEDQMGRPAINTVFVVSADKDDFNTTVPSAMGVEYQSKFETQLQALNGNAYTSNALGQDAATFTGLLSTDVLNVKTDGTTTFFDGTNVLTGRNLTDDVIDVELLLIFGGPMGSANAGLTSDNVGANDKSFLSSFPYLATPH